MESKEDTFGTQRAHVALGRVPGSFGWKAVKNTLAEADQRLAERPAAGAVPWRDAIFAFDHYVKDEVRVLEHPRYQRVVHRDELVDAILKAELQRPEDTTDEADTNFGKTVALRVVCGRLFFADLLDVSALGLG